MTENKISLRQKKISEQIKRIVVQCLMFDLLIDNPIKNLFSITKTQVSADLRNANIYIKIDNPDKRISGLIKNSLNELSPKIRTELGKQMVLKSVPEVKFFLDITESDYKNISSEITLSPEDLL